MVGPLLGAQVGESLRLNGRWNSHPRYGRQFQVHSYATVLPATIQGIRAYLGSGMIKGIGPVMAERMVAHFGTGILDVIEHQPGRLTEVHGLGPKRAKKISHGALATSDLAAHAAAGSTDRHPGAAPQNTAICPAGSCQDDAP